MASLNQFQIEMSDDKMRQIERQCKLRVKTGCETCRARRVKCDETKPVCNKCKKTGRKCEGYKIKAGSPSAAASYRNPSFLVVPRRATPPRATPPMSVPRSPSRPLSSDAMENRSFYYFQSYTLPKWTEFFDSELWTQQVLQLSHQEPAIKHGILALSSMHEKFEATMPSAMTDAFAFEQYTEAVRHSNRLISEHQQHGEDVEKVLVACIIFTCYENLAGNYRAANMHLESGLRILAQYRDHLGQKKRKTYLESIANVLYRFDLQAMTFSDNKSPYQYGFDHPPACPTISPTYVKNETARNDLVGLFRCMMWISGVANIDPQATENPVWLSIYTELIAAFETWDRTFELYQKNVPPNEQGDPRIYAGNTLLKMYSILARTIVSTGGGHRTETAWDAFIDSFKTIVDLAETLPVLTQPVSFSPPASRTSSPMSIAPSRHRTIAPNPATPTPSPPPGTSTLVFSSKPSPSSPASAPSTSPSPRSAPPKKRPASFSPSFELSPIVPLFVVGCRCRDPIIRRRAIALLLSCRRREGVWDSYGAGVVALQIVKLEEGLDPMLDVGPDNWLPLGKHVTQSVNIDDKRRVQDVFVSVNMKDRSIGVNYQIRSGEAFDKSLRF